MDVKDKQIELYRLFVEKIESVVSSDDPLKEFIQTFQIQMARWEDKNKVKEEKPNKIAGQVEGGEWTHMIFKNGWS